MPEYKPGDYVRRRHGTRQHERGRVLSSSLGRCHVEWDSGRTSYVQHNRLRAVPAFKIPRTFNLAAAVNCEPGSTLLLEPGAEYRGPIVLPAWEVFPRRQAGWWTVIETAEWTHAECLNPAKIVAPTYEAAVSTAPRAHHWRFTNVEITTTAAANGGLVLLGSGGPDQSSLDDVPHHFEFIDCWIHGEADTQQKRGIALNAAHVTLRNCRVTDCHDVGIDTQAVCGWNGPGPFLLEDCLLEGAGENVMFGGADPWIPGLVPAGIVLRRCILRKPLEWRGQWSVKNLFELKNARDVTLSHCLLENCWADAQTGFAILMQPTNQDGRGAHSRVEAVSITENVVRGAGGGISIRGRLNTDAQASGIGVIANRFEDIDGERWGGPGWFLQVEETERLHMLNNHVRQTGNLIVGTGKPSTAFAFRDNDCSRGAYGVIGDDCAEGIATLQRYFPGCVFQGNTIRGVSEAQQRQYPEGNTFVEAEGE